MDVTPDNAIFVVLSFEGPDVYSMAGGLGSRVEHLTHSLVTMGFQVHHIFIGDPRMEGLELREKGKLVLHRWCQWISDHHPCGVYDGEEGKLYDFSRSAPQFVVHELAVPAISEGKLVVILAEEWHTAEAICSISDLLNHSGQRDKATLFWNANNTYGFERIDWQRLSRSTTITTVSKYMKQIMLNVGVNSLVIPNGIPRAFLNEVDKRDASRIREALDSDLIMSKVARWHPDKGWLAAIDAVASIKESGGTPVLLARGGMESYGRKITERARSLGLKVKDVSTGGDPREHYRQAMFEDNFTPYFEAISKTGSADILNLLFPIPHSFLRLIYQASDIVLANSGHEPFGLVGLEAMAAGAVVFTGCSGEDYASNMFNAIVLDTNTSKEIKFYVDYLREHPEAMERISTAARQTAERWTWEEVVKILISKLEFQLRTKKRRPTSEAMTLKLGTEMQLPEHSRSLSM